MAHQCVDYWALNKFMLCNCYMLGVILEFLDHRQNRSIFTKINLKGAYNLVHIKHNNEWKMTYKTQYTHFDCKVMSISM